MAELDDSRHGDAVQTGQAQAPNQQKGDGDPGEKTHLEADIYREADQPRDHETEKGHLKDADAEAADGPAKSGWFQENGVKTEKYAGQCHAQIQEQLFPLAHDAKEGYHYN